MSDRADSDYVIRWEEGKESYNIVYTVWQHINTQAQMILTSHINLSLSRGKKISYLHCLCKSEKWGWTFKIYIKINVRGQIFLNNLEQNNSKQNPSQFSYLDLTHKIQGTIFHEDVGMLCWISSHSATIIKNILNWFILGKWKWFSVHKHSKYSGSSIYFRIPCDF